MTTATLETPADTAADANAETVLHLPMLAAMEAFAGVLPHASKDDVTPVLVAVQINPAEDGRVTLAATDRYTVGLHDVPTVAADDLADGHAPHSLGEPFAIPRAAAEWITKTQPKSLNHGLSARSGSVAYVLTITADDAQITLSIAPEYTATPELSRTFARVQGNYPPVMRLFPAPSPDGEPYPLPATVGLSPSHLVKLTAWATKYHRNVPLRFEGTRSAEDATKPGAGKLAPILVTLGGLRALIQPNLILENR